MLHAPLGQTVLGSPCDVKNLRPKEGKERDQGHLAAKRLQSVLSIPMHVALSPHLCFILLPRPVYSLQ